MTTIAAPPAGTLYVDMDGVLFASDSTWETLLRVVRHQPILLLMLPWWLLRGRAYLKRQLSLRASLAVASLPFRRQVIDLLTEQKQSGRRLVLATAADQPLAEQVANYLGLFDAVLASDGKTNLKGSTKRAAIEADSAGKPWDYIGDSAADLSVWRGCRTAIMAGVRPSLVRRVRAAGISPTIVCTAEPHASALLRACRPHQWTKNLLVAVPLVVSHQVRNSTALLNTLLAMVVFCLVSSGAYLMNDLLDLPADRLHPTKRDRPLAAGALSIPAGLVMSLVLLAVGIGLAVTLLDAKVAGLAALYVCLTTAYSLGLKRVLVLDVFVLAMLYALRVLAGAMAIHVEPSAWLLTFAMFSFISLAFVKRYAELTHARARDVGHAAGRSYSVHDIELFRSFGPASACAAALVFCLYINSTDVTRLYTRPQLLWLVCPILLYWMTRLWFLIERGHGLEDPVLFAVRDRVSYIAAAAVLLLILLAL